MNNRKKAFISLLFIALAMMSALAMKVAYKKRILSQARRENREAASDIMLDPAKKIIWFDGVVKRSEGRAQFLVYLAGYKWLEEESAIVSESKLNDFQNAIAFFDWKAWDGLWNRKLDAVTASYKMKISWFEGESVKSVPAQELVITAAPNEGLELWDLVYLGSPYFDRIALDMPLLSSCAACPLYPLERKVLRESFVRKSGESGYLLNKDMMPAAGRKVRVEIEVAQ